MGTDKIRQTALALLPCIFLSAVGPVGRAAAAPPLDPRGIPLITKIGTIDTAHQADGAFVVFKSQLYRLRWQGTENGYSNGYFEFVNDKTGEVGPPFARGYGCGQALVDNDTLYVSTTNEIDRPDGQNKIFIHTSKNMVDWQVRQVLDLPGWFVFKSSICKADQRYVMMLETFKAPAEKQGIALCRFATSPDMVHWTLTPPDCRFDNDDGFAPGHFLRYCDGKFYAFFLAIEANNAGWAMRVARSSDLIHWEKSPLNPVLRASEDDRKIARPNLTSEQRAWVAKKTDTNNSDMYFIEHDGQVIVDYFWDDQTADPIGRGIGRALYRGSEAQFLHAWFRENVPPPTRP